MEADYAMETLLLEKTPHHTSNQYHSSRSRVAEAAADLGEFFPSQSAGKGVTLTETGLVRLKLSSTTHEGSSRFPSMSCTSQKQPSQIRGR